MNKLTNLSLITKPAARYPPLNSALLTINGTADRRVAKEKKLFGFMILCKAFTTENLHD